jgi:O-antigen ligase
MYFRPTIFEKFANSNNLINIIFVCSAFILTVDAFFIKKSTVSRFLSLTLLYFGCLAISTFINQGSYTRLAMYISVGIFSVIVAEYIIKYHFRYSGKLIKSIMWIFTIVNIVNFVNLPDGIVLTGNLNKPVWFLGQATRFVFFYMPCLLLIFLYDCKFKGKITTPTYVLTFICLLTLSSKMAVGGFVGLLLFIPFFILYKRKKNIIVMPLSLLSFQILIFFWITYYDFVDKFSYLIVNILQKDSTLSSRTLIWRIAQKSLEGNELFGHGILSNETMKYYFGFVHLHNQLLQIIFNGGFISLIVFFSMCFYVIIKCRKRIDNLQVRVATYSIFVMGVILLVDTMDGVRNYYIFMLAIAACLVDRKIIKEENLYKRMNYIVSLYTPCLKNKAVCVNQATAKKYTIIKFK